MVHSDIIDHTGFSDVKARIMAFAGETSYLLQLEIIPEEQVYLSV